MPDPPQGQLPRRSLAGVVIAPPPPGPAYAELHAKTNFSFLRAASHADELVERACELGYRGLAVTDRNTLAGVVRAHAAAKELKLKLLVGAELTLADAPPLVLLATDRAAYGRLARLITLGCRRAAKGECFLTFEDVAAHAEGLLALVIPEHATPLDDDILRIWQTDTPRSLRAHLGRSREAFGDRAYLLGERHRGPNDEGQLARLSATARKAGIPLVAGGDVHYHDPGRQALQDVLTATRLKMSVPQAASTGRLFPNAARHLRSPAEMAALFARYPQAIARTLEVADRCRFSLDELRYEYPEELAPPGFTPAEYLHKLAWEGAHTRYPQGIPPAIRGLIEKELGLIEELHYEAYFLTVWDLVKFARSRQILCQGRGSAANSAVCYCLEITAVDPAKVDVLFERFVSRERNEAPDIDIDFEHERREEVLQYVYQKYGRERAGMTAEVITYRARSAIRDVGKALGLSLERVDALAKAVDHFGDDARLAARFREAGFDVHSRLGQQLVRLTSELVGFPRHLSQHVGGMVISQGPLCELSPIENAAMADRTVIQWDKNDLDALGILKVDCLALGMLTAIRKCFGLIEQHTGLACTLANLPKEDPIVYDMICRADTIGLFQIESRAQMSMLPRLKPREYYDLVIEVAIVRPGPIQGKMVHPFLRRRAGEEQVTYPNEAIRRVLDKTLGVPIFQEQAMRLAVVAANFTPGEADQLRRAMGAWRKSGVIEKFRVKLLEGMRANQLSEEFAERVFEQIRGFGEYGFPESHAASFALLVYVSAWLKRYYPAAFTAALLNSQPLGFYAPAQLVRDAREHGVEVRPADVNRSDWDCTLEAARPEAKLSFGEPSPWALRLGLRMISGLRQTSVEIIQAARRAGPFASLTDFSARTNLGQGDLCRLAMADAFSSLGVDRRGALWQALEQEEELPLFAGLEPAPERVTLPAKELVTEVVDDYCTVGLSLRAHPVQFLRPALDKLRAVSSQRLLKLNTGRKVRVAGLVLLRQRPSTAGGITFVTLEDETGTINLVIRPQTWEKYRHAARSAVVMLVDGRLERKDEIVHVLVERLASFTSSLDDKPPGSRDFR